jgi:hypothetical protein
MLQQNPAVQPKPEEEKDTTGSDKEAAMHCYFASTNEHHLIAHHGHSHNHELILSSGSKSVVPCHS